MDAKRMAPPSGRHCGLPAPVERFYRATYPDGQLPVYHSAVRSGRGTLRVMGLTLPSRYRFVHRSGYDYRHYFESTFYGYPILKVNEHFIDGHARLQLPFSVTENDPLVDSAANQGLWAEMSVYPAAYLTDGRVRWEAVDELTARLYVPWQEDEQVFTVHFDPHKLQKKPSWANCSAERRYDDSKHCSR